MPHRPKGQEGMEKPKRARTRKRETAKVDLEPPAMNPLEGRAPLAREGPKGLRRTTGS
jgi:hypothetical protein